MRLGLAVLLQLLLFGQAQGYCPKRFTDSASEVTSTTWQPETGQPVRVAFSDTLDAATIGAIEAAFVAWAEVECSTLSFEFLDASDELFALEETSYIAPSSAFAEIYVFWIDGSAEPPDFVQGFENTIAHTYPRHDGDGKLTTASIALNAASEQYPFRVLSEDNDQYFDVQTVMTQLVGEVIGLTTSDLSSGTVMANGFIYSGIGQRAPLEDDENGIRYLYWDESCSADQRPPEPGADQYCYPLPPDAALASNDGGLDGGADGGPADGGTDAVVRCTSTDQCDADQVCSAEGQCVSLGGDDGCSCATKADPAGVCWGLLLLLALGIGKIGRRRA